MNITVIYTPDRYCHHQTYKWVDTICVSNHAYAICVNHSGTVYYFELKEIKVIDDNYKGEWKE